ncbi:Uncharacterised protein [Mycobacteroides abscessus subsp. abscessus]|nr:Uncharacterised protein [Mycobacteroides abscessus subsp. abscessus]
MGYFCASRHRRFVRKECALAHREASVTCTAFGFPVLPLVNCRKVIWSAVRGAAST